jgi:sulfur relay (sulfurtransferase) complex TusBCD TusD component (DsrE family)
MKVLIVINDAPYGTERAYNAFRLAMPLQREHADLEVRVFLMSDKVAKVKEIDEGVSVTFKVVKSHVLSMNSKPGSSR